jgi:hypothetical protein
MPKRYIGRASGKCRSKKKALHKPRRRTLCKWELEENNGGYREVGVTAGRASDDGRVRESMGSISDTGQGGAKDTLPAMVTDRRLCPWWICRRLSMGSHPVGHHRVCCG